MRLCAFRSLSNGIPGKLQKVAILIFLIRVRKGFTKTLWKKIHAIRQQKMKLMGYDATSGLPTPAGITNGVELRTLISLPMGSAGRTRWERFSTVVIVCGGSGVTFGMATLEHLSRRMSANKTRNEESFKTLRIRFVWIMKEYGTFFLDRGR